MSDVTIPFDPDTCPDPSVTIIEMNTRAVAMLDALRGFVCDKDAESIARYNALVAAVTALRDNTATAINNLSTVITTDADGIAAANIFIAQNKTAIDAIVAGVAANTASASANTASATANTASAAANAASTAANTALLATVESLANAVKAAADALAVRVASIETAQALLETAQTTLGTEQAAQATRIETLETAPQQSLNVTAIEEKNVEQDGRLDAIESDSTAGIDAVCAFSKALKAAVEALPATPAAFACLHGIAVVPVPDMGLIAAAADAESGAAEL